ncbi:hypothetical protein HPULCUR_002110 [Helicostylum pulchrum]|uniref:Uncharacterized protein n=1 Tax=Helicostylum pulchrum TaxID=562976 RepID=A0ABP9XQV8_9FUNG
MDEEVERGKTARKFEAVTTKWSALCAKILDVDKLAHELDPIIPELKDLVREANVQGQQYMAMQLKLSVEEEVKELHLPEKFNRLDELVEAAKDRGPVMQRVGPTPEQVIRGVSCREKEKENKRLLAEFNNVRRSERVDIKQENDTLMAHLSSLKNELSSKRTNITNDVEKFKKSTMIANTIPTDELLDAMNKLDLLPERR